MWKPFLSMILGCRLPVILFCQEGFTNNELPNTNVKDKNYPYTIKENEDELTSRLSVVNKYQPKTAYTDKYYCTPFRIHFTHQEVDNNNKSSENA